MDSHKESTARNPEEVVLAISGESPAAESSSNQAATNTKLELLQEPHNVKPKTPSPEFSNSAGMSPKKPPRPPQSEVLLRLRSIAKPKSRFEEPTDSVDSSHTFFHDQPSSSPYNGSPNKRASGTPKTRQSNFDEEEEEEEDEVYKKELL